MDTGKEQFDRPNDLHVHPLHTVHLFQRHDRRYNTFQTDHSGERHSSHKHDQENPLLEHDVRRREFLHGERRRIRRLPRERLLRDPRKKLRESHGIRRGPVPRERAEARRSAFTKEPAPVVRFRESRKPGQ